MNETAFNELAGWVTEAGLIGRSESELMVGEIGNWRVQKLTLHSN